MTYLHAEPCKHVIVHCTHGFNRTGASTVLARGSMFRIARDATASRTSQQYGLLTGYMLVNYMVRQGLSVAEALHLFAQHRPPGIYKADYIDALFKYNHELPWRGPRAHRSRVLPTTFVLYTCQQANPVPAVPGLWTTAPPWCLIGSRPRQTGMRMSLLCSHLNRVRPSCPTGPASASPAAAEGLGSQTVACITRSLPTLHLWLPEEHKVPLVPTLKSSWLLQRSH